MADDALFDSIADRLSADPRVTRSKMFGSPGLKVGGKVFAFLAAGKLVVKLPRERVGALVASGHAEQFDPGMGRRMKEWAAVEGDGGHDWRALAEEARDFVAAQARS